MPSAGGARFVVDGREVAAEVRESVRVVRRAGRVVGAAILEFWEDGCRDFCDGGIREVCVGCDCENGSFSRLGTRKTPLGDFGTLRYSVLYLRYVVHVHFFSAGHSFVIRL